MICRAKRKRALRGRNHAEGYPGGLIETMNGGVRARSCAAQPPSDRKTPCLENPGPKGGILTNGERRFSISGCNGPANGGLSRCRVRRSLSSRLPGTNLLDEWIGDLPLIAEVVAGQLAKITCPTGRQYIENRFQRQSASPGPWCQGLRRDGSRSCAGRGGTLIVGL